MRRWQRLSRLVICMAVALASLGTAAAGLSRAPVVAAQAVDGTAAPAPPVDVTRPAPLDTAEAEQELLDLTNTLRAQNGLAPLRLDPMLSALGKERSEAMLECDFCSFNHYIPDVGYAPAWLRDQVRGALGAGENLGLSTLPNDRVVQSLFQSWLASPTHLENLLRPQWTDMGLGVVEVPVTRNRTLKVMTHVFVMAGGPLRRVG